MKINITTRLFLLILIATVISIVSMVVLLRWDLDRTVVRHFSSLANATVASLQERVGDYYKQNGTLQTLKEDPETWANLLYQAVKENADVLEQLKHPDFRREREHQERSRRENPKGEMRPFGFNILLDHFLLFDQDKGFIIGGRDVKTVRVYYPVHYQDQVVGYIGFVPTKDLMNNKQKRFLSDIQNTLLSLAGIVVLVSALIALLFARKMVRPIKQLAAGTHKLAAGDLTTRVEVRSQDEIGTLADDFNHLAFTLEKNEQARRQWMAEISHELRTPVAVLRGEIEALQDGVRAITPAALDSLHAEAVHLGRLADDLYQLAMSDVGTLTYQKEALDLVALLKDICDSFDDLFQDDDIELTFDQGWIESLTFFGDDSRLRQLFDNLLENALKYTDRDGQVKVGVSSQENKVIIDFQDSSPGVERDELEKLLDRFYRSPKNQKTSDGAGLGLSICRNIVEGHQGTMKVSNSPYGGLWVQIELPIRGALT